MAEDLEKSFADQLESLMIIDNLQQEREALLQFRQQNHPKNVVKLREAFQNNRLVKSDVKKSSAFVKKIRAINAEGIQQCIRDTETLNLTQYVSEIVTAILATTYKAAEIPYVVKLCVSLHQKYDDFTEPLVTGLKSLLLSVPSEDDTDGGKRRRINVRVAVELYQVGILMEDEFFCQLMRNLLGRGKTAQMNAQGKPIVDLQGVSTLVKYGSELLFGFLPKLAAELAAKAEKKLEDFPSKLLANTKVQTILRNLLTETYDNLCNDLVQAHQDFRSKESKCEKDKLIHGNVTEQKQADYDYAKKLYEKLLSIVTVLSDATGAAVPELKIERDDEDGSKGLTLFDGSGITVSVNPTDEAHASGGVFGDAETRSFYEDLPDLLTMVPLSVLGFTPEQANAIRESWSAQSTQQGQEPALTVVEEEVPVDVGDAGTDDVNEDENAESQVPSAEIVAEESSEIHDETSTTATQTAANAIAEVAPTSSGTVVSESDDVRSINKLDHLLNVKLLDCLSKQKCDDFCVSFCYLNSKTARRKLVDVLSRLPRFRLELAPFFARIVASLGRIFPEMLTPILDSLRREFFGILKARRQTHVDSKVRNVRYQAELVKFRCAPPIVAFRMMKALFTEFTLHTVEMLATVMESCGRFLFLVPYTHTLMQENLDTMMRLKRARNLDLHSQTMLESAYFAVKPPERSNRQQKKDLTIVQKYARFLLQEKLEDTTRTTVDQVVRMLRRLPWNVAEENIDYHVMKAALKVARTKYVSLPNLADCLSGLAKYYPNVVVQIVDRILEELQRSLDSPYKREIQRILGITRLLGELYNFMAVPSSVIFDLLYHLIQFGHQVPSTATAAGGVVVGGSAGPSTGVTADSSASASTIASVAGTEQKYDPRIFFEADAPTDLFRAQVICELLNTTGVYFVRGSAKDKLNRFLTYFQRYLLTKQMIPMHVEFTILDTFDHLDNLAKEAILEKLPQQQQSQQVAGNGNSKNSKAAAIDLDDLVITGYQFVRFDNFEAAQQAVEVLETTVAPSTGLTANNDADNSQPRQQLEQQSKGQEKGRFSTTKKSSANDNEDDEDENEIIRPSFLAQSVTVTSKPQTTADEEEEDEEEEDGGEDSSDDDEGGHSSDDDDDSSSGDSDDDDSSDDDSDEDDDSSDESDDDHGDEEDEDDDGEDHAGSDSDGSEEAAARVLEKMRLAEEDDEFERAFKSVMQESVSAVTVKHADVNRMVIPAILPKPKNLNAYEDESSSANDNRSSSLTSQYQTASTAAAPKMAFKLLSRDNKGRIESRQLFVPSNNAIAQNLKKVEEETRLEKQILKERTLQISSMAAEAEFERGGGMGGESDMLDEGKYFGQREIYTGPASTAAGGPAGGAGGSGAGGSAAGMRGGNEGSGGNSRVNKSRFGYRAIEESKRAANTLDLDGFLAEVNAAEIRRISTRKN